MQKFIKTHSAIKHKIELFAYMIVGGFCSAWNGAIIKFMFSHFSFWTLSLIFVYEFAFFKSCMGMAHCVSEISKEEKKSEDAKNATEKNK